MSDLKDAYIESIPSEVFLRKKYMIITLSQKEKLF